nr:NLR family CARD domain-containing protein 3 [Nothobranchius furzeri]
MDQMQREVPATESTPSGKPEIPIKHQSHQQLSRVSETEPDPDSKRVSLKSDQSKEAPLKFKGLDPDETQLKLKNSEDLKSHVTPQISLPFIFMCLEENIIRFVKKELKKFQEALSPADPECFDSQDDEEELGCEEEERRRRNRESLLNITLNLLKKMKQEDVADLLQSRMSAPLCQSKLKENLKTKFQVVFEGIAKSGNPTLLNQIFTELYITEGETGGVHHEHEVRQIEAASRKPHRPETTIRHEDFLKVPPGRDEPIRTVMTKGVAGIGKTVLTQKFTLDWTEDKTNQNIHFMFPFTFRELNVLKEKKFSLVELVHHFFSETKNICSFEEFQVVFIFDGLDECRLPLDFHNNQVLTDVTESTSVDVLLTNLIKGNLLPSARLWITSRPAAANQIPPECVGMVTEIRGFTDLQKEEYFRKSFKYKKQTNRILSHLKNSRSLHIMCHIPVFCWITATVLKKVFKNLKETELPTTLTEMYIHFLVVQTKVKQVKYDGGAETDPHWNPENKKMMEALGKLAFDQLQKGHLIFYESDLIECGINIRAASLYSGVFTQIFKEERGLHQDKVFCFVHLSVQEFLAALHVHLTFINSGINLFKDQQTASRLSKMLKDKSKLRILYKCAVDKALESPNGHLNLLLRFLLGLSLPANQILLQGLLTHTGNVLDANQKAVEYIKKKISKNLPAEKSINLFHCLNELHDRSLVEEIQQSLRSGSLSTDNLSPAHWSALVFILLSSDKNLDVFELKKYSASEEALLMLLPVVKVSNKVLLSGCNLSERSCEALASILSSRSSSIRDLDLSNNNLQDAGVKLLCGGLKSPNCRLESLSLSGCQVTQEGCTSLASALNFNPSHLKDLDLSYNHPGDSGEKMLTGKLKDPCCRLDTLSFDQSGEQRLIPGLRKYACRLTLDPNTAHKELLLSLNKRKVTVAQKYPCMDHPERFDHLPQLLCGNGLAGRCYWEVDWRGVVKVAVTYRGICRKGNKCDSIFGRNDRSWSLLCSEGGYSVWHDNRETIIPLPPSSLVSKKVAVYLDCPSGTLSFYKVSDTLVHLHTFRNTFTELLYPGFGFGFGWGSCFGFSVTLCEL